MKHNRIVIGISSASGAVFGVRLLELLKDTEVETHLVVSKTAALTIKEELSMSVSDVQSLATESYQSSDLAARISSGSFKTDGMIIAPCSMKSLAEIATGISSSLIPRAADVMLKEKRRLVLLARETPLHSIHLNHMLTLSNMGAIIAPPVPAFYNQPQNIDDLVNHTVGRVLDLFDIDAEIVKRWDGLTQE